MKKWPVILAGLLPALAFGQHLSVGLKGGIPMTDSLSETVSNGAGGVIHSFSDSKEFLIGPMVEVRLPFGFAVEADALYRPLNLTTAQFFNSVSTLTSSETHGSWEYCILGKYSLSTPVIKPYVELGPAFRSGGGSPGDSLSKKGFAAGFGIDLKLLRIRTGPEIRYIHWGSDLTLGNALTVPFTSNTNQAEFLIRLTF